MQGAGETEKESCILLIQYAKSIFQHHEKLPVRAPTLRIIKMNRVHEVKSNERTNFNLYEDCQYSQVPLWIQTQRRLGQGNDTDNLGRSLSIRVFYDSRICLSDTEI